MSTRWAINAATAPGARHLEDGEPSEDAFVHAYLHHADGDILFLALADGAGSAARAAEGAAIAVGTSRDVASRRLAATLPSSGAAWRTLMGAIAAETVERVAGATAVLAGRDAERSDFGCTLIVAIVAGGWAAVFAVGDSFAVLRRVDGGLHLPHVPTHPDGDVTQTALITQHDALSSVTIAVIEDAGLEAVALASDGLDRAAVLRDDDRCVAHAPFLQPLFARAGAVKTSAELAAYLLEDEILAETTDDDRTLLIAVRR